MRSSLALLGLGAVAACSGVAQAQTPLKPTARGDAKLPCRTPGRRIKANDVSAVSIYSPSEATRKPARQTGFYGCTRGHRFRRLGPDPVSQTEGEGNALADPALAGHFAAATTQFCSRAGCFGGAMRTTSLATGRTTTAPLGTGQSIVRFFVTREGVTVYSTRTFSFPRPGDLSDATLQGGAVWRLAPQGRAVRLAFDPALDAATLQLDDPRVTWSTNGVPQTASVK